MLMMAASMGMSQKPQNKTFRAQSGEGAQALGDKQIDNNNI